MGYTRSTFNPETYIRRGQTTKQMHCSCLGVLNEIIPKITGYSTFSLIRPAPTGPTEFLYIDPVGVILMQSLKDSSADTIALLIDHDVQVPAKFTDKVIKRLTPRRTRRSTSSAMLYTISDIRTSWPPGNPLSWTRKLYRKNVNA